MKTQKHYFDLEYQINYQADWRPAMSLGESEAEAISNFAMDYSPSMGTVTAVRAAE
jgi:hypothetical protein